MGNEGGEFSGPKRRGNYVCGGAVCQCAINCSERWNQFETEWFCSMLLRIGISAFMSRRTSAIKTAPAITGIAASPFPQALARMRNTSPITRTRRPNRASVGGGDSQDFCPGAGRVDRREKNPKHRMGDWHGVYLGSILAPVSQTRQLAEHRQCTYCPVRF
jgi:hypothetical protein